MNRLRRILFRLQPFFRKKRIEADLSEELRIHLEMATAAHLAAGLSPEQARCAARREFGGIDQAKEAWRDERGLPWLEDVLRDLRHSARSLLRDKGFTVTVLLIFALCLGANVAIFALVNQVLLRPLPFPEANRLVTVYDSYPKGGVENGGVSALHYFERTVAITAFSETSLWFSLNVTLGETGSPEPMAMMCITPSFFRMLGVKPELGRNFLDEEGIEGKNLVAMLSDEFWRSHFNADPTVLGRTVRIDAELYTVIGVVPPGFHYLSKNPQIWGVCAFSEYNRRPDQRYRTGLEMIARLRPEATIAEAQAQVDALNARPVPGDTLAPLVQKMGYHTVVDGLQSDHVAQWRTPLLLLQTGVLFLMLIGAVNLANLLLVRASGRTREFAVRQALGASRRQLSRTLVVETLLLAIVAGVLGLGLAAVALRGVAIIAADHLPPELAPALDRHTCLAAAGLTLVIGLLLALPAAWQTLRGDLATGVALGSRGGTMTRTVHRFRHGLVVAQIAFAFVLLAGVGLLGLSFIRVMAVDPGFRQGKVLAGTITLPWLKYQDAAQREIFVARLLAELRAVPGVIEVGTSTRVPFAGIDMDDFTPIDIEGRNLAPG
jgi:predicted permease